AGSSTSARSTRLPSELLRTNLRQASPIGLPPGSSNPANSNGAIYNPIGFPSATDNPCFAYENTPCKINGSLERLIPPTPAQHINFCGSTFPFGSGATGQPNVLSEARKISANKEFAGCVR